MEEPKAGELAVFRYTSRDLGLGWTLSSGNPKPGAAAWCFLVFITISGVNGKKVSIVETVS